MVCADSSIALNAFYGGLQYYFPHMVPAININSLLYNSVCIKLVQSDINELADQINRDVFFSNWATDWSL